MHLDFVGISIFTLAYAGIALGEIPGLGLDRAGVALLGGLLMLASGILTVEDATAALDYETLILLFGLMVLSAQYRLGGFYSRAALFTAERRRSPAAFLAWLILLSAALSAVLCNDIVCLALTPVVASVARARGWNPVPFLLSLAASSNLGSAATIIGNPQNMFIGSRGRLPFGEFLLWCGPPSALGVILLYLWAIAKGGLRTAAAAPGGGGEIGYPEGAPGGESSALPPPPIPFDAWQSGKALLLTAVLLVLFFTRVPREIAVAAVAAVLLMSRRLTSTQFMSLVDWPLLVLFIGLFVLIEGFKVSGGLAGLLSLASGAGLDLRGPAAFGAASVVLSNVVSNVPAVMLLMASGPPEPAFAYLLALTSTYAGNLLLIGSIANLIVVEQARKEGIFISFRAHFFWNAPFALVSIALAFVWWFLLRSVRG